MSPMQPAPAAHLQDSHTGLQGSARGLLLSTLLSGGVALVLLITVVLPAEYNIDPTGVGRLLGLTQMGEIKEQLSAEAAADAAAQARAPSPEVLARLEAIEKRLDDIAALVGTNAAQAPDQPRPEPEPANAETETVDVPPVSAEPPASAAEPASDPEPADTWRDEVSFVLAPGQGIELKLVMEEGAEAEFEWSANGGVLNYDTHGDGSGQRASYEKGRGVPGQSDRLVAAFTGKHGWFFRNRMDREVTLTLRVRGDYVELVRTA